MGNIESRLSSGRRRLGHLPRRWGSRYLRGCRQRACSRRLQDSEQSPIYQDVPPRSSQKTPQTSEDPPLRSRKGFLYLPKELRFLVYEELITHQSQDVILRVPGELDLILTLITPSPIPPIHLTCKTILDEAVPIMQRKLSHKSAGYPAPRAILRNRRMPYPDMADDTQVIDLGLFDDFCFDRAAPLVDLKCSDVCEAFFNQTDQKKVGPTAPIVANSMIEVMRKMERYFLRLNGPHDSTFGGNGKEHSVSWMEEASDTLHVQHNNIFQRLDRVTLLGDIRRLANRLTVAPGSTATGISLYIAERPKRSEITEIVDAHLYFLRNFRVRIFVYTSWEMDEVQSLLGDWIFFQGKMTKKMWAEEWA